MPVNTFNTTISSEDQKLGFSQEEIVNPDGNYYLATPTISAVVKNVSSVERVIKINTPFGYHEYLHQWKDSSESYGDGWSPCCHNHVHYKNQFESCQLYSKFEHLIDTYGNDEVRSIVLKKELSY
jgi:hypothetical protein